VAKNGAKGGGRRGAIRNRTQFHLPSGHWAKRDIRTGEIISVKADRKPYKGVVREKHAPATYMLPGTSPASKTARVALPSLVARPAWQTRHGRPLTRLDTGMVSPAMGDA
jgi:hypothetical protein